MPRRMRIQYPGARSHVMSRGDQRDDIFLDDVDRHDFIKTLAEPCQKAEWQVHAFCLMRNRGKTTARNHAVDKGDCRTAQAGCQGGFEGSTDSSLGFCWCFRTIRVKGNASKSLTWAQACQKLGVSPITVRGRNPGPGKLTDQGVGGVQMADVSVDVEVAVGSGVGVSMKYGVGGSPQPGGAAQPARKNRAKRKKERRFMGKIISEIMRFVQPARSKHPSRPER